MSRAGRGRDQPRAMIHRRILDVAAANPDASLARLADEVSGASATLVERVLDEYGDPSREPQSDGDTDQPMETTNVPDDEPTSAAEQASNTTADAESEPGSESAPQSAGGADSDSTVDSDTGSSSDTGSYSDTESDPSGDTDSTTTADAGADSEDRTDSVAPDEGDLEVADLPAKQRRTLEAVHERPDASQGDLAEQLDVTRATISRRLNAIPGFEWAERKAFAESVFEGNEDQANAVTAAGTEATDSGQVAERAEATRPSDHSTGVDPSGESDERRPAEPSTESVERPDPVLTALGDVRASITALDERVTALESQSSSTGVSESGSLPPKLAHKVVHACMKSERISEAEELELLRTLMQD